MAGRRGTRDLDRSSRAGSSPVLGAASAVESGSATVTSSRAPSQGSTPEVRTRSTYRNLIILGLAPDEAANLTAWLAGLGSTGSTWSLGEINRLLFLRQMQRAGHFTEAVDPVH